MSRIGKRPVSVPNGVTTKVEGQTISVKGPRGELALTLVDDVTIELGDDGITVAPRDESKRARSMWGMSRSLVENLVVGVTDGFSKTLEINGVGYRAALRGKDLQLNLGYSHDVVYSVPEDIQIQCPKPTEIVVSGIDRAKVGQVAAEIRRYRKPEPYKGKGVKYSNEFIFRKEGKKKK
jgi:large subunit ribosomal protein L6